VVQTLAALAKRGEIDAHFVQDAVNRYHLADPKAAGAGNTEGGG
jgi:pyruvate dehydrogenase complex dehydrogenase (E1) component